MLLLNFKIYVKILISYDIDFKIYDMMVDIEVKGNWKWIVTEIKILS